MPFSVRRWRRDSGEGRGMDENTFHEGQLMQRF